MAHKRYDDAGMDCEAREVKLRPGWLRLEIREAKKDTQHWFERVKEVLGDGQHQRN